MGDIFGAIFGGASGDAADAQVAANREGMREYKKGVKEAKGEIAEKSKAASEKRLQRAQQALDVMERGFGPQLAVSQMGNLNAQNTVAQATPQMANAILGNPIDYGSLQPQTVNFDANAFLSGMPTLWNAQNPSGGNSGGGSVIPTPPTGAGNDYNYVMDSPFDALGGSQRFNKMNPLGGATRARR